jgi:hypothetical protein
LVFVGVFGLMQGSLLGQISPIECIKMNEEKYRKKCCYERIQAQVIQVQVFDYSDIDWYDKTHREER